MANQREIIFQIDENMPQGGVSARTEGGKGIASADQAGDLFILGFLRHFGQKLGKTCIVTFNPNDADEESQKLVKSLGDDIESIEYE